VARRLLLSLDLPGGGLMASERRFTDEQLRAIERRDGSLLLSAGAGTGKTSVLVERFVRAVVEDGVEVDSILAITFTEKAAAELRTRVHRRFLDYELPERARDAEAAWISTIHSFCARVLRTHALPAGLDPELRVLDGLEAERVAIDSFDRALGDFLGGGEDPERLRLLAAYTPDRLADMVRTAYSHLRSRGASEPDLPEIDPPREGGERAALLATAQAALTEIGSDEAKRASEARGRLERCGVLLERLTDGEVLEASEVGALSYGPNAKVLKGPASDAYREAHGAYERLCTAHREYHDHVLLRELLGLFHARYSVAKRERSALDFADLELMARDLLKADAGLREHYANRFEHVMVDEMQDTNPLQNEILELLERDNLFRVGDERQSIYRFRHADLDLFRTHRAEAQAAGRAERIGVNFRSRGEILDAIDLTFGGLWGEDFDPLREPEGARAEPPRRQPCVELLVTDGDKKRWDERFPDEALPFGAGMRAITPWRAAEARLLARRVDELTGEAGPFSLSDVVVLVRATTHVAVYERALEERGISTHVLGGRGYWGQQQVGDLRAWLAALANPLDALALHSVLASPLVGLSLDALVILAAGARRAGWGLWRTLEAAAGGEEPAALVPEADLERVRGFVALFAGERAAAPRISLETLIDRAVTRTGYDRAVLAMPAGDRRMANVRKLMRMAREYEAEEGRDLRSFIDFVAERDLVQEQEGQAPLEAEDLDAVRVMTIHRAKGLEFPVVCVADLGKTGREDDSALRINHDGRVGIRLAQMGGGSVDSASLGQIREESKLDGEEEERRIFYVAATRAQEHLVLSGATDLERLKEPGPLDEPMRWLWRALAPELPDQGASFTASEPYEGRSVAVRCEVLRPGSVDELLPATDRDPTAPESAPPGLDVLAAPALAAVVPPDALPVSRLSYSGLESYRRCGYRFYLERALGLPRAEELEPDHDPEPERQPQLDELPPDGELPGLVRGSLVHALLEELDFAQPSVPSRDEVAGLLEHSGLPVIDSHVRDLTAMVEGFVGTELCERIGRAERVHAELPFGFTLGAGGRSLLINGIVDVHATEGERTLVVDYKSNRLDGQEPADITEAAYSTQRLVYALAALRAGASEVEVVYAFLERPTEPVSSVYPATEAAALESELLGLVRGVVEGRFDPTDRPHRALCAGCPGRAALCSWDETHTLAEEPPPA